MDQLVLDAYDDNGAFLRTELWDVARHWVDKAAHVSMEKLAGLAPANFALILQPEDGEPLRKFAMVDPGNTWMSVQYFLRTGYQLPEHMRKMAAANLIWGSQQHNLPVPQELVDMAGLETGPIDPVVSLTSATPRQVKQAEHPTAQLVQEVDRFRDNWNLVPPQERRGVARQLIKHAEPLGIDVQELKDMWDRDVYGDGVEFGLQQRISLVDDPTSKASYREMLVKHSSMDPEVFAHELQDLDLQTGMFEQWDTRILDPFLTTYGQFQEKAAEMEDDGTNVIEMEDMRTTEGRLQKLAEAPEKLADLRPTLRSAFIDDPLGVFYNTTPPVQRLFVHLANQDI